MSLNTLCCDRCGYTQYIPPADVTGDVSAEEMERFIQVMFFAVKRTFGEQGWFTSVGYDLCPDCCKSTGTQPGYNENGLLPETVFTPRPNQEL